MLNVFFPSPPVPTISIGLYSLEIYRYTHLQQSFSESGQFLYGDTAHQKYGDQTGDLGIVVASLRYILEDIPGFFPA